MSGTAVLALAPLLLLLVGLIAFCLVDVLRSRTVRTLPKPAWAVVVFLSPPFGALAYLIWGRQRSDGRSLGLTPQDVAASRPPAPPVPVQATTEPDGPRPPAVATTGLTRDYGHGAGLFDVDLLVPAGTVYGLVGPNGAGKTTLLSILTGLRRADRGSVDLGIDRRRIAVCPDVPEFEPWLTAYEVVDLARSMVTPAADQVAVLRALVTAGLAEVAHRRVGGFSRGMTQRLGLAAALVGDPQLLVLDEPTSALDPAGRAEILDLVGAMRGRRTVLFSSHILADVQRVADVIGIVRGGRLLYQGPTQALVDEHLTPRWSLRLASPLEDVATALAATSWATHLEVTGPDTLRVDARSLDEGERGLPAILAATGARLVSCEPLAADLESAFLALTAGSVPSPQQRSAS